MKIGAFLFRWKKTDKKSPPEIPLGIEFEQNTALPYG